MSKGFVFTTDAVLALVITSLTIVILHNIISIPYENNKDFLQSLASDASYFIELSNLNDTQEIVNNVPPNTCLLATINKYINTTLINQQNYTTNGCPHITKGEKVISRRTYINDYNYIIIVKGWKLRQ